MFEKSHILRVTLHQHINLKQSLKIEIHKFWVSNMHKICGSQNCIKMVINNSSRYYNMFSYINLGFYQTWDEFLRELQLIHRSQNFIFFGKDMIQMHVFLELLFSLDCHIWGFNLENEAWRDVSFFCWFFENFSFWPIKLTDQFV